MSALPGNVKVSMDAAKVAATPAQPVVRMLSQPGRPAVAADDAHLALLEELRPALAEPRAEASALAVASTLAHRLGFERVSLGIAGAGTASLLAVSDAPDSAPRSGFARAMEAAMAEAADHGQALHFDGAAGDFQSHRLLAAEGGAREVYSVPLHHRGEVRGVLVCERLGAEGMASGVLRTCDALAGVLAPALELKRRDAAWDTLRWLQTRRRLGLMLMLLAAVAALSLVQIDYRVSAPARVEGVVQRVVVAPFDGYVETASVRAGERVVAGQELATLQRSGLDLERGSAAAEYDELEKQHRRALVSRDRAEARVLEARMAQVQATLDLLDARIARTRLTAPFDGVVLNGDLARSLGAPVQRGQVLFEVAPANGYRIVLQAGERDVRDLAPGMSGALALAALPDTELALTVEHVSGAARTEAGQAVFLVESRLDGDVPALRPGMEGVAKVAVEPRSLIWILTHPLVEWLQLALWSLLP